MLKLDVDGQPGKLIYFIFTLTFFYVWNILTNSHPQTLKIMKSLYSTAHINITLNDFCMKIKLEDYHESLCYWWNVTKNTLSILYEQFHIIIIPMNAPIIL